MKHFVVAIGREFGAQGCDIAEKLAEKLGVKLYDRQLVEEAAKKLEMDEHTVQKADEVSAKDIEGLKTTYGVSNFYCNHSSVTSHFSCVLWCFPGKWIFSESNAISFAQQGSRINTYGYTYWLLASHIICKRNPPVKNKKI